MQSWDPLSLLTLPATYLIQRWEGNHRPLLYKLVQRRCANHSMSKLCRPKSSSPPILNQTVVSLVYLEYSMSKQICPITKIYSHWYWWSNNAVLDGCHTVMIKVDWTDWLGLEISEQGYANSTLDVHKIFDSCHKNFVQGSRFYV